MEGDGHMKGFIKILWLLAVVLQPCFAEQNTNQPPAAQSRVDQTDAGYRLLVNEQPMEIRGALATGDFAALVKTGANCVLLPGSNKVGPLLDEVAAAGLSAAIRLPLTGNTPEEWAQQRAQLLELVKRYKNHPALLMWVIVAPVASAKDNNAPAYHAVNELARMIDLEDAYHVVVSDVGLIDGSTEKPELSAKYCPDVDVLGCAMGCTVTDLLAPLRRAGWQKPFLLIGCGRPGPLPEKRASWGAPLDGSTAGRQSWMIDRLTRVFSDARSQCLGTIFFSWDVDTPARSVWVNVRTRDGSGTTEWVDAMTTAWTGRQPANRCPVINAVNSPAKGRITMPGVTEQAAVTAEDPEKKALTYTWTLVKEFSGKDTDGLPSSRYEPVEAVFSGQTTPRVALKLPDTPGTYRLCVTVSDGNGRSTESGIPFLVQSIRKAPVVASTTPATNSVAGAESAEGAAPDGDASAEKEKKKPLHVTVEQNAPNDGWQLMVDGQPFFVKGAGGKKYLEELQAAGANAIRTWSTDAADQVLNDAEKHGLKVCLGLWMKQERHNFDYNKRLAVEGQLKKLRASVRRYKNHPALLMWCCGIEVEWGEGTNVAVYEAINEVAGMVHQEDTNHPTTTAFADLGENSIKAALAAQYCPELDIFGVNSYGGLNTMASRLKEVGWTRPYMIMEFGPKGQWEVPSTVWGAEVEQSPVEKARFYEESYNRSVSSQENWCLGSFVFSWDYKMECTPTWYSMHLIDGKRMNTADTMWRAWSGREPTNRCPEITWVGSSVDRAKVLPGKPYSLDVDVTDADGDSLTYEWILMSEVKKPAPDQTIVTELKRYPGRIKDDHMEKATLTTPTTPGAYRVFIYVYDGMGNAASANMPFFVNNPES